jgi:hypothetical protein
VVWVDDPERDLAETLEEAYRLLASGFVGEAWEPRSTS